MECSIKNRNIFVNNVAKVVAQRLIKGYNDPKIIRNSSGQGEIPYRRYSPRPALLIARWLIWCNSITDSKVWMREDMCFADDIFVCIYTPNCL